MAQGTNQEESYLEKLMRQMQALSQQAYAPQGGQGYAGLVQAQTASKDPQYASGLAVGKLLKMLHLTPQDWANNYMERGIEKGKMQTELRKSFGDNADAMIQDLKNQGMWNSHKKLSEYYDTHDPTKQAPAQGAQNITPQEIPNITPDVNRQTMRGNPVADAINSRLPLDNLREQFLNGGNDSSSALSRAIDQLPTVAKPFDDLTPEELLKMLGRR